MNSKPKNRILSLALAVMLVLGAIPLTTMPTYAADTASLKQTIESYGTLHGGNLTATVDNKTITVTGEVTGATSTLFLTLDDGITVVWKAALSGNTSDNLIQLQAGTGPSIFEVAEGGSVINANSFAIGLPDHSPTTNVVVTGGLVHSANAAAIHASGAGNITVTGGKVGNAATEDNGIGGYNALAAIHSDAGNITVNGNALIYNYNASNKSTFTYANNPDKLVISGDAVLLSWQKKDGTAIYSLDGTEDIFTTAASAHWGVESGVGGIYYSKGGNSGFLALPDAVLNATSTAADLKAKLASTTAQSICVIADIEMDDGITVGADHELIISDGKTVSTGPYTLTIPQGTTLTQSDTGKLLVNGTNVSAIGIHLAGTLALKKDACLELANGSGTGYGINLDTTGVLTSDGGHIDIKSIGGATMAQPTSQMNLNGGTLTTHNVGTSHGAFNGGIVNIADCTVTLGGTGIQANTMSITDSSVTVNGHGGLGYLYADTLTLDNTTIDIKAGSDPGIALSTTGTLTGTNGSIIRLAEGAKVSNLHGKLSDRGLVLTATGEVTAAAADSAPSATGLTAGDYVWDGTHFTKQGDSLNAADATALREYLQYTTPLTINVTADIDMDANIILGADHTLHIGENKTVSTAGYELTILQGTTFTQAGKGKLLADTPSASGNNYSITVYDTMLLKTGAQLETANDGLTIGLYLSGTLESDGATITLAGNGSGINGYNAAMRFTDTTLNVITSGSGAGIYTGSGSTLDLINSTVTLASSSYTGINIPTVNLTGSTFTIASTGDSGFLTNLLTVTDSTLTVTEECTANYPLRPIAGHEQGARYTFTNSVLSINGGCRYGLLFTGADDDILHLNNSTLSVTTGADNIDGLYFYPGTTLTGANGSKISLVEGATIRGLPNVLSDRSITMTTSGKVTVQAADAAPGFGPTAGDYVWDGTFFAKGDASMLPPAITIEGLPAGKVGQPYDVTLTATSPEPFTWSIDGDLPDGLFLEDDHISGTPETAGYFQFAIVAESINGYHAVFMILGILSDDTEEPTEPEEPGELEGSVPTVESADPIRLDVNGTRTAYIRVSLGASNVPGDVLATSATVVVNGDAADVDTHYLDGNGNILVTAVKAGDATIDILFDGLNGDTQYDTSIDVKVTESPLTRTVYFYDGDTLYTTITAQRGDTLGDNFPANPTKPGYTFAGWRMNPDGTGQMFSRYSTVGVDINVYATWKAISTTPPVIDDDDDDDDDTTPSTPDSDTGSTASTGGSGGGGGAGGGFGGGTAAAPSAPRWTTESELTTAIAASAKDNSAYVQLQGTGTYGVNADQWSLFGTAPLRADSVSDGVIQMRLTLPEPGKMTTSALLTGAVKGAAVASVKNFFEKWYTNKLQVLHLDQSGSFQQGVQIAAKLDLTGMDISKLVFYSYDKATNTYKPIGASNYRIDANGYLHFTTALGGDIVISEGPLAKK
ncbi:InlB B-repeat-containing protein [Ruminococcaceae bacterium OttesenSCG-928-L11]|nr:InlB B-repeat-containing protein [Ruminococcaceae bacterium OttesenSCG-928-L11]